MRFQTLQSKPNPNPFMKMNGDDDDPFASVAKLCHTSSSQEVLFRNHPFARQSEAFSDDEADVDSPENNEAPVESTGIVMVSPPDSSKDDNTPHDEFHTPPEDSLLASSEEQRITTFDHTNHVVDDGDNHEDKTVAVESGCTDGERTVDLGKDSDLGFSEVKSIERIYGVLERESPWEKVLGEFPSKRLKLCEENLAVESPKASVGAVGDLKSERVNPCNYTSKSSENCHGNEEMLVETKHVVSCNGATEVVESECEENDGVLGFGEETAKENFAVKEVEEGIGNGVSNGDICEGHELHSNGEGGSVRKSIEDIEKFRYVGPSGPKSPKMSCKSIRGRRALPSSICGRKENAVGEGELVAGVSSSANQLWTGLLDVLKMLAERCECDPSLKNADMLEIAQSRGMTFPWPSWCPPEGFEEE